MPRRHGSGTAQPEADAAAALVAALINRDAGELKLAEAAFNVATSSRIATGAGGGVGYTASSLVSVLSPIRSVFGPGTWKARTVGPGNVGDVVLERPGADSQHIEIKAQLTLEDFTWIQSADWIRGPTDTLGAIAVTSRVLRAQLEAPLLTRITASYAPAPGWSVSQLWAADLVGLTSAALRRDHAATTASGLRQFAERKYLLHVTQEGGRLFRLAGLPAFGIALAGGLQYEIKPTTPRSQARIWTAAGHRPVRGTVQMVYYLGQNRRDVGGHHVHEAMFDGATSLI
jgi:hypothetical protein